MIFLNCGFQMAKKFSLQKQGFLPRQLTASLAGLRAGGALMMDSTLQKMLHPGAGEQAGDEVEASDFARREARRFVDQLGRLKGTYVKIGQMLALFGEHFLPPVLTEALHELGSQTEPLPWHEVEPLFASALGDRYAELEIEPQAIAAASLAQVHRAVIRATGEQICLKLQYPGLQEVIDADFNAVVRMLLLARWVKAGRDLDDWLESMRVQLHHEIDYQREAQLHQRMYNLVASVSVEHAVLSVPALNMRYCSDTLLGMEYIDGLAVNDQRVSSLPLPRRNALAKVMLELFFYELYDWGLLQTDPNFGNYLIRLDEGPESELHGSDELVLLDFGSILDCDEGFLFNLRRVIAAGQEGDMKVLADGLEGLGCLPVGSSEEARKTFGDFCMQLLEPLLPPDQLPAEYLNQQGEYCWSSSNLMRRAGKLAALSVSSRHFSAPSREFALIARKLTGVFTFISVLEAEFNAYEIAARHISRWRETATDGS